MSPENAPAAPPVVAVVDAAVNDDASDGVVVSVAAGVVSKVVDGVVVADEVVAAEVVGDNVREGVGVSELVVSGVVVDGDEVVDSEPVEDADISIDEDAVEVGVVVPVGEDATEHDDVVATGHVSKHGAIATVAPPSKLNLKLAAPVAPPGDADHVAPPILLMAIVSPPMTMLAAATLRAMLEKMTLVYHAFIPSNTVATGPLDSETSQSTGSYVTGKTPVLAPVIASKASTWQSNVFALPESTICTIMLPGRPGSVAGLPSYDTRKHEPQAAPAR
mmetsp:Transcript_24310/g.70355  ORF Transcript_24310/g.70355 Transcript_24310/m.70355 type:complete len:276 (+) Transcript_24310:355-1182(+)